MNVADAPAAAMNEAAFDQASSTQNLQTPNPMSAGDEQIEG